MAKRSPDGLKRHLERTSLYKKEQRKDPEFLAKEALKARERYHRNKEKYRKISKKWHDANREVNLEKRRIWRRDNPDIAREADKRGRQQRISYFIARLRDGSMGLDEFNQRINAALIRLDERLKPKGSRGSNDSNGSSKTNPESDETSIGCLESKERTK